MKNILRALLLFSAIAALSVPAFCDDTATAAADPQTTPTSTEKPKPAPAPSGAQIKVNDNVNIKFGILLQPQLDMSENASEQTLSNLLLRRVRFIVGGQVAPKAFFFFQTENSRLGQANAAGTKTIASGFQTIDAVGEYRFSKPFNVWAGLIYLPTSREALKSSASEFMIDVNAYAYTATTALQGTGGRDTGVMARGYFLNDKLEYRAGLFSGIRANGGRNAFRQIARLQYNLFDTELYALPSFAGSYFGSKKIVALGAAYDKQQSYKGPTADVYVDMPTSFGSALGTATVMRLDGGTLVPTLGKSNIFVIDGGIFAKGVKIGPWARYEQRKFSSPNTSKSEKHYLAGVNWYPNLNNFNIKAAVGQLKPEVGNKQKQLILQMQFFYF